MLSEVSARQVASAVPDSPARSKLARLSFMPPMPVLMDYDAIRFPNPELTGPELLEVLTECLSTDPGELDITLSWVTWVQSKTLLPCLIPLSSALAP